MEALTSVTGDSGILGVGRLFSARLGWHYRAPLAADVGIDALVEPVLARQSSGRLLALQIKAGNSWFREQTSDGNGWIFRENSQKHLDYWLNYKLPVLLVIYDIENDIAYWQHINTETTISTEKGFKVKIPRRQRVDATAHDVLARLAREIPPDNLAEPLAQLPPSCASQLRRLDETNPAMARDLATRLVDGRDEPSRTIRTITANWDDNHPWLAWLAVGEYANEYALSAMAAELFLAADRAGGKEAPSARLQAFAGLMLSSTDPDRARNLLAACLPLPESHLLAIIGLATLGHGINTGPVPVPPDIEADPDGAAREPTVQWFLAEQRQRVGDSDGAIQHHRQALVHAPWSAKQTLALADALLRRAGAGSITSTADYREAATYADTARANFRRWHGNSVSAAHVLMQARIMAADDASAFRVAQAQPDGEATETEATSPLLAFTAARIAYERGDLGRAERFGALVEASDNAVLSSHLAAIRVDALETDITKRQQAWEAVLAAETNVSQQVVVCAHLAAMGKWPIPELDELHATGLLTPGTYETQHARALAASNEPDTALAVLRGLRDDSLIAAEAYVQLLAQLGRADECVRASKQASLRLGAVHLELVALDVLTRAGLTDEFVIQATDLLGRTDLPLPLRHHIRVKLIEEFTRQQAWNKCEHLAHRGLLEITHHQAELRAGRYDALTMPVSAAADLADLRRQYAWAIIIQQLNQGRADQAFDTLTTLAPDIRSAVEATVWFDLHQLQGWTLDSAERALALAQQSDQSPDLAGRILATLIQSVPTNDDPAHLDFHERLGAAWRSYLRQHQSQGFPVAGATPEQTLDQVRSSFEAHAGQYQALSEDIKKGVLPVAAASTATSHPYLLGLVQRVAGLLPAMSANDEMNRREVESARAARGGRIAVETSALYVAAALLGHWQSIQTQFSDLLLSAPTERDIRLTQTVVRGLTNVTSTLSLDLHTGQPEQVALTDDVRITIVDQCTAVYKAAQACRVVPINSLEVLEANHQDHPGVAWLAPIATAVEHQIPLYSDDVVLRATARAKGVPSFGTMALLDALIKAGRDVAPDNAALATLFDHLVVDLPQAGDLLFTTDNQRDPLSKQALLNLARPAVWQRRPNNAVGMLLTVVSEVPAENAHGLATLISACAAGWAAAFTPADQITATLAALVLAFHAGVTPEAASIVVPAIQGIAEKYDPDANPIPCLFERLVGILTDPTGEFQLTREEADERVERTLHEFT